MVNFTSSGVVGTTAIGSRTSDVSFSKEPM